MNMSIAETGCFGSGLGPADLCWLIALGMAAGARRGAWHPWRRWWCVASSALGVVPAVLESGMLGALALGPGAWVVIDGVWVANEGLAWLLVLGTVVGAIVRTWARWRAAQAAAGRKRRTRISEDRRRTSARS